MTTPAQARKYPTPGSRQWVRGFAAPEREATTLELRPAVSSRGRHK